MFVGSADAEVAEFSCVAQGDGSGGVDDVVAGSPCVLADGEGGMCFGAGSVGLCWGASAVCSGGSLDVVDQGEGLLERIEGVDGVGWVQGCLPAFGGLVE